MIMIRRSTTLAAAVAVVASVGGSRLAAQATTGSIGGRVTGANGEPLEATQVQITNPLTGVTLGAQTRNDGRYAVLGVEPGSNYRVTFRRIGYAPQTVQPVAVTLGQTTPVNVQLNTQATQLSTVTVEASAENSIITPTRTGATTTISDSLIRKLPTLNRSFTDFVSLTPQVSQNGPGLSAGGVNNRFNNIQIDGATEKDLFGLGSTGQPGGQAGGKSIGIESVKEYQVLLAPFDVRVGQFAGLSVNAITKSGTNEFHGSAYGFGRNQNFQRSQPYLSDFKQAQYGVSLGGPVLKDRVFFFVNPEWQQQAVPASGYVLGDPSLRLTQAQLDQFTQAITSRGLSNLGGGGFVNKHNPLTNVFARLDIVLPYNTTLILRENYAHAEQDVFSRGSSGATPFFPLSDNRYHFVSNKHAPVAQLRTNFTNGAYNELILGYTAIRDARETPGTRQAQVVTFINSVAQLQAGTENSSQANALDQDTFEFTDNFTIPLAAGHRLTIGTQNQFYHARNVFGQNSIGNWTFGSIDSLVAGNPRTYQIGVPVAGTDGSVRPKARQLSAYVQDDWTATDRLNITLGLRADIPSFLNRPPLNPTIQQTFNVNTSDIPTGNLQISPRFGFNYNVTGDLRNVVRGGVGTFVGSPAYVWLSNSFQNSGGLSGFGSLTCTGAQAPRFTAENVSRPPTACANGTTAAAGSEVDLLDKNMKFPQTLKADLAYDRALGRGYVLTFEGLYTKNINDLFYYNLALQDAPIATGFDGRALYGLTPQSPRLKVPGRTAVYAVKNYSKAYAYNLTGKLEKRFRDNFGGAVAYTYGQARDVQSLTSSTAGSQYRFGRVYAGSQLDLSLAPSAFETKHRIVANGSYTIPKTRTSLAFIYTGNSGLNYAYVSNNDLNGDNQTQNDPVYVPTGASDPKAPVFQQFVQTVNGAPDTVTVARQSAAFFGFIDKVDCLRKAKGSILGRNSCTTPWINQTDISIEQALPTFRGQNVSIRLDGINFMNFLNKNWGRQVTTSQFNPQVLYSPNAIVTPVTGSTSGADLTNGVPRIQYNPDTQQFNYNNVFSNYTFQLSVRYSF